MFFGRPNTNSANAFKDCLICPDENCLVLLSREMEGENKKEFRVQFELNFKYIIEMMVCNDGKKQFPIIAPNDILEIKYARNIQDYENYIIAKWKKLQLDQSGYY